jgi:hypothetical protein
MIALLAAAPDSAGIVVRDPDSGPKRRFGRADADRAAAERADAAAGGNHVGHAVSEDHRGAALPAAGAGDTIRSIEPGSGGTGAVSDVS